MMTWSSLGSRQTRSNIGRRSGKQPADLLQLRAPPNDHAPPSASRGRRFQRTAGALPDGRPSKLARERCREAERRPEREQRASTTALFGVGASGLVDGKLYPGFLFGGGSRPAMLTGFQQDRAAFRQLCLEVIAFLQPSSFAISRGRVIRAARRKIQKWYSTLRVHATNRPGHRRLLLGCRHREEVRRALFWFLTPAGNRRCRAEKRRGWASTDDRLDQRRAFFETAAARLPPE